MMGNYDIVLNITPVRVEVDSLILAPSNEVIKHMVSILGREDFEFLYDSEIAIEPFTWGWAIGAIASGILSRLGAQAISKALPPDRIPDLQRRTIDQLVELFRAVLEQEALSRANARVEALAITIENYTGSRDTSLDRLSHATNESNLLVQDLARLGLAGYGSYFVAGHMQVAILQERMIRLNAPGEFDAMLRVVERMQRHNDAMSGLMNARARERCHDYKIWQVVYTTGSDGYFYMKIDGREYRLRNRDSSLPDTGWAQAEDRARELWTDFWNRTYGFQYKLADVQLKELRAKLETLRP